MTTLVVKPAASGDDGLDATATGGSFDNSATNHTINPATETAFIRLPAVAIPGGSAIATATLALTETTSKGGAGASTVQVWAHNTDNASAPANSAAVTSAFGAKTAGSGSGTLTAAAAGDVSTVDVTTPVSTVLARGGWASGNAVLLLMQGATSGGGQPFKWASFDDGTSTVFPSLTIDYTPSGPWLNFTSGIAARNGTTTHTIPFGFTSTSGSLLCVVVFGGVTHSASGWTEQLSPVSSGELSVFTKTSAGDSSITVTHNASNYPVEWAAYEFPAGSTYTSGDSNNASSETFPTLSGLPGTEQLIIAARGRIAGGSETNATTVWTAPWVEGVDLFTAASGTDGGHLTIGVQPDYTGTSITPSATTTYSGTWGVGDREKAVFAIEVAAPSGGPITGDAALAVTATLAAAGTSAKPAAAALSVTATLAAGTLGSRPAAAARTVTATLTAGAAVAKPATAALSVTATFATSATSTKPAAGALAVTATLAASSGAASTTAAAALSATATLAAGAVPTRVAAAALSATATLTAVGTSAKPSAATLSVTATLAAGADVGTPPVLAGAALAVTATLTAGASRTAIASAALSATATLTAGATRTQLAQAALAVTAALNAGAPLSTQVAAALAVVATLTASLNAQGSITYRPFTGTTSRPFAGITPRP